MLAILVAGGMIGNLPTFRALGSAIPSFPISTGGNVAAPGGESLPLVLAPSMKAALDIVVQRYRVSPEALRPVFEAVQSVARERDLDPLLLVAVISIESRFNPYSQSPMGAQGLMQIIPRFHQDKVPPAAGEQPFLDPLTNVRIGARILQEAIQRQGSLIDGLQYYAGAADDEDKTYASKIMAERLRLEPTARRKDATAN
ncbi:MAG: transglycosylase SLT domain-containing protein [Propionivibrio sp.]|nr:transglycosylase SLT domain-containing protein [Propionivibrio sp.]